MLVVSEEATMPDAAGRPGEDVVAELEELVAAVSVSYRYVPDQPTGTVLSTTPEAGAPVPAEVTVELAESSSSVYLTAFDTVEGGCDRSAASRSGAALPR